MFSHENKLFFTQKPINKNMQICRRTDELYYTSHTFNKVFLRTFYI